MSETAKHTPGPWQVRHGFNVFGQRRDAGIEATVATCGGFASNQFDATIENEANARLIAAAPALLEACVSALPHIPEHVRDMLIDAIAAAEGGQHE